MIIITDNLGNYAEASIDTSEEESAGVAVTTFLKDDPDCTTVVVTRKATQGDILLELEKIKDEFNERMGWS
jgi:hypothetical protein